MRVESQTVATPGRNATAYRGALAAAAAAAGLLLAATTGHAASAARSNSAGGPPAVTFESVPGSSAPRVILTARAVERLGIETGKVKEESVTPKQMVSGLVVTPSEKTVQAGPAGAEVGASGRRAAAAAPSLTTVGFADFSQGAGMQPPQPAPAQPAPAAAGDVWVLVTLSPGEWERLAKDRPARLLPLPTRDEPRKELWAQPSGMPPLQDMKRSMLSLYYVVPGKDHGLTVNHRVRVELQVSGNNEKQKVVPYGAVYYDAKGTAWVYVNTRPLAFERQRIAVDRIVGDLAILSEGPPVGTSVVTVGAALLYGTEIFKK